MDGAACCVPSAKGLQKFLGIYPSIFDIPQGFVGAESYNGPIITPPGYGFIVQDGHKFGANMHLINNIDLAPINGSGDWYAAARACNEGFFGRGKGTFCIPELNVSLDAIDQNPNSVRTRNSRRRRSHASVAVLLSPRALGRALSPAVEMAVQPELARQKRKTAIA